MKKFLLSIFAVMLAVFSVQAEEYSYTLAKGDGTKFGDVTWKGVKWNISADNTSYCQWDGSTSKGYQFGSSKQSCKTLTLSTSGIEGTITEIVVNTSGASSINASLTVSVGGIQYGNSTKLTSASTDYTFENTTSSASGEIKLSYANSSSKAIYIKSISITYTTSGSGEGGGGTVVETVATPIITPETTTFNEGESVFVSIATETQDAEIYYTLDGTDPSTENGELYEGEIEITETTTVKAIAVKDGWNNSEVAEAKYTKTVVVEGGVVDVLNLALTGAEGTTYSSWSGKTSKSSAVYAGQSAGGNNSIQLRSSNSNSGIVTTQSGGKVKKISIDWNSNTAETRELWVYGKNTAYTNPTELYNASTDGDKLAEIPFGTLEFVIEGDYEYIGLRSGSGAMYLNSIEITWVVEEEEPATETWSSFYAAFSVAIPEGVEAYIVTAANAGYVTLTQIYNAVPANTGVILKGGSIEATYDNYYSGEVTEVTGNLLKGTMTNIYISEEAYVLGKVDGVIGLYKALMTDGQWLNNANKAYLPASEVPAAAQGAANFSFRFEGEGTTAIENVEVENEVKTIYDLTGRKVEVITAPGIYIVNGVKRVVR